jgi:MFS family permease
MFLLNNVTVQGLAFFAPTIVGTIYPDLSTKAKQIKTVPPYIVGAFFTVLFPALSWRFDRRNIFIMMGAPLIMVGYIMFLATDETQGLTRYGATFIIASGAFAAGPLTNAQVSANVVSDTSRGAAIGTNVMLGNVGGLISTWGFLSRDGPNYPIGNGLNLATGSTILLVSILLEFWMIKDNRKRAREDVDGKLDGFTQQQVEDLDWKHPAFRWRP